MNLYEAYKKCLSEHYVTVENDGDYSLSRDGEKLTIYFEWSDGKIDWLNNFNFPAKPYRDMKNLWFAHRGFLKVWKSIEPYIAKDISDPTVKKIDIVGYSHGAAIAQLCFEYVKFNRPDVEVAGVGFGSPRVFWGFAKKTVKDRFKGFIVIRNGHDLITHLPPVLFGFRHICKVRKVGRHWGLKDFIGCVKKVGLKATMKKHAHIGCIKDHYQDRYLEALREVSE